jgi:hypothetical protein
MQQTPSAQNPEAHWLAAVQAVPGVRLARHLVWSQKNPFWHSPSALHVEAQELPMHMVAAQPRWLPAWQLPLPSQSQAEYSMEAMQ